MTRAQKAKVVLLGLTPLLIVIADIVFVLIRDAVYRRGESLVQRAYRVCGDQATAVGQINLDRGDVIPFIHQARHCELTREELIGYWEETYTLARYIRPCNDAIIDAGFDIAERWDGKPKR